MAASSLFVADLDLLLGRPLRALDGLSAERWRALLDAAFRHGTLEALAGRLPRDDRPLRARFEHLATLLRARDAELREALAATVAAIAARGIEVCALKGPVLADRVHPEPALRPAGDLDLLVREEQLAAAIAALETEGYRRLDGFRERYERRHAHHVTLVHDVRPPLELHFRPQSGFGSELLAAEVLSRARAHVTASGVAVRVLAPEDELIMLALHAAQHLAERRGWLLDLLLLLDVHPELDWCAVAERASAARCRRAVGYTLLLLARLGAPVPTPLVRPVGALRAKLADRIRGAALARPKHDPIGQGLRMVFDALLCDTALGSAARVGHQAHWFVRRRAHALLHPRSRSS